MRKLLVSSLVSLDGVVESPMTWASRFFDNECTEYALHKLDDVEFFLLGRKAYQTLAPVWSTIKGNAYIDRWHCVTRPFARLRRPAPPAMLVQQTTLN